RSSGYCTFTHDGGPAQPDQFNPRRRKERKMGLNVSVYRNKGGGVSTNGGISWKADSLRLVNVEGPAEPNDDTPAAMLVKENIPGALKIVRAVLVGQDWVEYTNPNQYGPMFGGNYAATSDSKFDEASSDLLG